MFATLPDGRQKPPVITKEAAKPSRIVPLPKAVAETKSVWTQPVWALAGGLYRTPAIAIATRKAQTKRLTQSAWMIAARNEPAPPSAVVVTTICARAAVTQARLAATSATPTRQPAAADARSREPTDHSRRNVRVNRP